MPSVLLELNDCGVRCANGAVSVVSPGYALLEKDRIITGEEAREKVFVAPQVSFSQFWQQLNLSPLAIKSPLARHNADLAYAHLMAVLEAVGQPAQIALAVPGSFSREQLGILLGLAQAAKVEVTGLVDSALLATHQLEKGDYWHLDIQLHQLVATQITITDKVRRGEVILQPGLGLRTLHDLWAHAIADQFISQYRYDPLHHAQGEQQLHDRLPGWLEKLQNSWDISLALASKQGDYQLNLDRSAVIGATSDRFYKLKQQLEKQPLARVVLSHRLALLPGIGEVFDHSEVLQNNAVTAGFQAHSTKLGSSDGAVRLVTELPLQEAGSTVTSAVEELTERQLAADVTHLLYQGVAWPLDETLLLDKGNGELHYSNEPDTNEPDRKFLRNVNGKWFLKTTQSGAPLACGAQVQVEGHSLTLIRVAGIPAQ